MNTAHVSVHSPGVRELVDALTAELASSGYADDEMFGYSLEDLEQSGVDLVAAYDESIVVAIGGIELTGDTGELKRFYVRPSHRGSGVADAVLTALLDIARTAGATRVRLETGTEQHAAIAFYRRNSFAHIPKFGPYVASESSICMERAL